MSISQIAEAACCGRRRSPTSTAGQDPDVGAADRQPGTGRAGRAGPQPHDAGIRAAVRAARPSQPPPQPPPLPPVSQPGSRSRPPVAAAALDPAGDPAADRSRRRGGGRARARPGVDRADLAEQVAPLPSATLDEASAQALLVYEREIAAVDDDAASAALRSRPAGYASG